MPKTVTHVSGMKCHLSLRKDSSRRIRFAHCLRRGGLTGRRAVARLGGVSKFLRSGAPVFLNEISTLDKTSLSRGTQEFPSGTILAHLRIQEGA